MMLQIANKAFHALYKRQCCSGKFNRFNTAWAKCHSNTECESERCVRTSLCVMESFSISRLNEESSTLMPGGFILQQDGTPVSTIKDAVWSCFVQKVQL